MLDWGFGEIPALDSPSAEGERAARIQPGIWLFMRTNREGMLTNLVLDVKRKIVQLFLSD
jgi:hypothetical protein